MKVFILTKEPFPIGMAATNRITNYARGLVANGVDCEVIVCNRTEQYGKERNFQASGVTSSGVPFRYIPPTTRRSTYFIGRRIHDFKDDFAVAKWIKHNVAIGDCILYYNIHIVHMRRIIRVCHQNNIKIVRELCEYPYGTRNDSAKAKIKRWLYERFVMPKFDGFIAISESLQKYAEEKGRVDASIIKVPILIDKSQYDGVEPYTQERPYVFHAGTMYERKDAIVSTMRAFALACKQLNYSIDFILIGPESPHKEELNAIITENHLENNVHFLGSMKYADVLKYQKGAWLTILNKHDNVQNRNGFSTKLGDVLLAGTPVITTTVGEANNWLKDEESALITKPHNIDAIAEQIIKAYQNPELLSRISRGCKQVAISNFDLYIQGERLKEYFG
ncbi:MAG: glycosyltransferase family 4 protein [Tidjanibacter sp.]|nr:glycosyltransferase family 4 protein [Tidjanibacter sp.]